MYPNPFEKPEPPDPTHEVRAFVDRQFGGEIPPDILALCHLVAENVKNYAIDGGDWLASPYWNIDIVRIRIQYMVLQAVAEAIRRDRQSGPSFFGTVPQDIRPSVKRSEPPLRSWIRRNGKKERVR